MLGRPVGRTTFSYVFCPLSFVVVGLVVFLVRVALALTDGSASCSRASVAHGPVQAPGVLGVGAVLFSLHVPLWRLELQSTV